MKMKKLLLTLIVFGGVLASCALHAQPYQSAIGARLGYPFAISYKFFVSDPGAFEIFGGPRGYKRENGFSINGLYQHHFPITGADYLSFYLGGGLGLQLWNNRGTSAALLGNLGLDYKFVKAPLNIGLDWVPIFYVNYDYDEGPFAPWGGSLYVRYVLK